jgi:hypothetical protein
MALRSSFALIAASTALISAQPSFSQAGIDNNQQRAANLARDTAIKLNGGLIKYRPAACMFVIGGTPCLVKNDAKGFLFRFEGGSPAWQQLKQPPTTLTEILVAPGGREVVGTPLNKILTPAAKP